MPFSTVSCVLVNFVSIQYGAEIRVCAGLVGLPEFPRHHGVREVLPREPNGEVSQLAINAVVAFSVLEQAWREA